MGRHRAEITRESLLRRYAAARGMSFERAEYLQAETPVESLRAMVENVENLDQPPQGGRRTFAKAQPTTSLQGQTR